MGTLPKGTFLVGGSAYGRVLYNPAGGGFFLTEDTDIIATIPDDADDEPKGWSFIMCL